MPCSALMLDHAISVTHADRGLLIEPDSTGALRVHQARSNKGENLPPETLNPSQTWRLTRPSANKAYRDNRRFESGLALI